MHAVKVKHMKQIFHNNGINRISSDTYDLLDQLLTQLIQQIAESYSKLYPNQLMTPENIILILKEKGYNFEYEPTVTAFSEDEVEL